ncbi:multidrug efflux system transcriptional repressor MtrR [Neisseria animalis]|uniref:TetR family transcriptional regulator n=1 Tax=Neisseria animalis TaxID=492 RepID=A0A5P3MSD6_NEIAN|nr:TetR family transcriptional regulator [Neisseria animalis]QEY24360.1 TetR family transcriptional regulator [Neisseria animalis]ROW31730.1 TetR family transcriptional regulator [Neisseria animalis]VEE06872.1 mtrCDE transcriptional repressor [Neisseria animalis]
MRKTKIEALKTKEHLMLAALEVFYQKGVARASLNEIAQTAGVTRGALYWHFKNKEDLFDSLFQRVCNDIEEYLEKDLECSDGDHLSTLRLTLLKFFERVENNTVHKKFYTVLFTKCEYTAQNEAIVALMEKYRLIWHGKFDAILQNCIKQQSLPAKLDTETTIIYLKSVVDGLLVQWLTSPVSFELNQVAPRIVDISMDTVKQHALLQTAV